MDIYIHSKPGKLNQLTNLTSPSGSSRTNKSTIIWFTVNSSSSQVVRKRTRPKTILTLTITLSLSLTLNPT